MKRAKSEYSKNFSYLLQLLSCVLNDKEPAKPNCDTDWASVFYLADCHSVSGMVYCAILKLPDKLKPEPVILGKFRERYQQAIVSETNIELETRRILKELSQRKLYALPLKGIVLKSDYPQPFMRTMSDVDILYKVEQQKEVKAFFERNGYKLNRVFDDEMDFTKPPCHHYELHGHLVPTERESHGYFRDTFSKVKFTTDEYIGELSQSDFYIYLLEHLAKHFECGGAGVRMIMDIYVFLKSHRSELDDEYLYRVLSELRLVKFREKVEKLSQNWFGEDIPADTDSVTADFILCSCTFGTSGNSVVAHAINYEKTNNKKYSSIRKILGKIFPSYSYICMRFPSAKKMRLLYPVYIPMYWSVRFFIDRNVTTKNLKHYIKDTASLDAQRISKVFEELSLDKRL